MRLQNRLFLGLLTTLISCVGCSASDNNSRSQLDKIVDAVELRDVESLNRLTKHIQRAEGLKKISGAELVQATSNCSVERVVPRGPDYSLIFLKCPDRQPSDQCRLSDLILAVITQKDDVAMIELDEAYNDGTSCSVVKATNG